MASCNGLDDMLLPHQFLPLILDGVKEEGMKGWSEYAAEMRQGEVE